MEYLAIFVLADALLGYVAVRYFKTLLPEPSTEYQRAILYLAPFVALPPDFFFLILTGLL